MGGTPRRAPERSILKLKRAIWSTFWVGGQNPSLDCSWPALMRKKGAGARYIRQIVPPSVEKRGGRTIHSSFFVFKGGKKGRAHDTFDNFCLRGNKKGAGARYIRQIVPSGPSMEVPSWGGPHGEPQRGRFYLSNGPSGALSGWAVKTPVWTAPRLPLAASGGVLCESGHKSRKKVRE